MSIERDILRCAATHYLHYTRGCPVVLWEYGLHGSSIRPDVLGVTEDWHLIEIEIKTSKADLLANTAKRESKAREVWMLVTADLICTAMKENSSWVGVMSCGIEEQKRNAWIHRQATQRETARISKDHFFFAVRLQAKTLASASRQIVKLQEAAAAVL